MPDDLSLPLRRAIVAGLQAFTPLTDLVSAARVFGEETDKPATLPHVRYGLAIALPYEAIGLNGSQHDVTLHVFAHGPFTDSVQKIARQVVKAMEALAVPDYLPMGVADVGVIENEWTGTQILTEEGSPAIYHAVITFLVTVAVRGNG